MRTLGFPEPQKKENDVGSQQRQGIQRGGRSIVQHRKERPQSFSVLRSNPGGVDHIRIPQVPYTMKQQPTFSISNYFKEQKGVILAQIRSLTIM